MGDGAEKEDETKGVTAAFSSALASTLKQDFH